MNPITLSLLIFACVFAGSLVGIALRSCLPEHHLSAESKEVIKLGAGLIGTMSALLLGLLVASAKNSYDSDRGEVIQMAAKYSFLDRVLAHYGPDAQAARTFLHDAMKRSIDQMWPEQHTTQDQLDPQRTGNEALYEMLHALAPKNDEQHALKSQALSTATDIGQIRWLLLAQRGSSISTPMLVVVIFWLSVVFLSFGLFARPNATVLFTLCLCAISVAGAIFLVLELDQPFGGLIQISSAPMQNAVELSGK